MGEYDVAMRIIGIAVPVQALPVELPLVSAREFDFLGEDSGGGVT